MTWEVDNSVRIITSGCNISVKKRMYLFKLGRHYVLYVLRIFKLTCKIKDTNNMI